MRHMQHLSNMSHMLQNARMDERQRSIKLHNTALLATFFETVCDDNDLQPATRLGAAMTLYIDSLLRQARQEGIAIAHRNLARQIAMLQALHTAPTPEAMEQVALDAAQRSQAGRP